MWLPKFNERTQIDQMYEQLITIRKTSSEKYSPPSFEPIGRREEVEKNEVAGHVPAHKDFRMKYFKKFNKDEYVESQ